MRHPLILTSVLLLAGAPLAAQTARLAPAASGDLVPASLTADAALPRSLELPAERVSLSWPLDGAALDQEARPHVAESRSYWVDASSADLRAGIPLFVTSPRAVVRLNPAPGTPDASRLALAPDDLVLEVGEGRRPLAAADATETLVGAEELAQAGVPFAEGTIAFRVRKGLESETLRLRVPNAASAAWVIHVFEPESRIGLSVTTDRDTVLAAAPLEVRVTLAGAPARSVVALDGFAASPAGNAVPLRFRPDGQGAWTARIRPRADATPTPGLWEAHVSLQGNSDLGAYRRYVRTAFAVSAPTARIAGDATWSQDRGGLTVRIPVEVGSAGRYETRGVLYGTVDGRLVPIGVAHAAGTLSPGIDELALAWDRALMKDSGASFPFEIRDLRLNDQARMALLQRQARGFVLTD